MTRSGILAVAIFILLIMASSDIFAFDITEWKYKAEITMPDGTDEYCSIALTPEVYDAARLDLGDVRLIDSSNEQISYVLAKPEDITKWQKYQPKIINRSIGSDKAAMVTLDFGRQVVKNSIEVITGGDNFRRVVKVDGSNDNIEFFTLVEQAYVFAVTHSKRFERVDLPANDYRYLRIGVSPMSAEEKSPVINGVKASEIKQELAERQFVPMEQIEHNEDEENNSSIYTYDLAYSRLPISEIELDVAGNSFYRYVTVEGRDAATRKVKIDSEDSRERFKEIAVRWERIVDGTVYRYIKADGREHEKLILHIPSGRRSYRYLRIKIRNYDDKPIIVKTASAKMIVHNIVFSVQGDTAPTLYVGSESAKPPRYDLEHRLREPLRVKAGMARLGGIINNPAFGQAEEEPIPWTEKHKILLFTILAVVVLVLVGIIFKSFESMQSEQNQN